MARATHLTIGTADRIRLDGRCNDTDEDGKNEVRQEIQVSVTYVLDPEDADLTALAAEKAGEVQQAHEAAWNRIGALGNGIRGGTPCACPSELEEDDGNDGADDGPQGTGRPSYPSPIGQSAGARYLAGASRPSGGTGMPETSPGSDVPPDAEPMTGPQKILIRSRAAKIGLTAYALDSLLYQQFKIWRVDHLTKAQAASLLVALDRDLKECEAKERASQKKNGAYGSFAGTGEGRAT